MMAGHCLSMGNVHEPVQGQYNFEGNYDLVKFIKLVQEHGMYVTIRLGPFIQAEWNHGGLPYWLREVPGIIFRSDNTAYKYHGRHCGDTFTGPNKPNKPSLWTENWTAQYRVFGDPPSQRAAEDIAFSVARFFSKNGALTNYYMYHGGTNFEEQVLFSQPPVTMMKLLSMNMVCQGAPSGVTSRTCTRL